MEAIEDEQQKMIEAFHSEMTQLELEAAQMQQEFEKAVVEKAMLIPMPGLQDRSKTMINTTTATSSSREQNTPIQSGNTCQNGGG